MVTHGSLYVAEVSVPVYLRGREDLRGELPRTLMNVDRGYWRMRYEADILRTRRPVGMTLTLEFAAEGRAQAETTALLSGQRFQEIAAFFSGSPLRACKLERMAAVDPGGLLTEQHVYFHEEIEPSGVPFGASQLARLSNRIEALDRKRADRVRAAIRWQTLAVGAPDPAIRFTALWFGLESIGPALDRRFHRNGPRVACEVCGNAAGEDRNRGLAGIQHLVRRFAPEIPESAGELKQLRDDIAHCLQPVQELELTARRLSPDVEAALTSGILSALAVDAEGPGAWESALPKDYAVRPGERFSLYFPRPLPGYRPWLGNWVEIGRTREDEYSSCAEDGEYHLGFAAAFTAEFTAPREFKPRKEYMIYERDGLEVDPRISGPDADHPLVGRWEERSPVRERLTRDDAGEFH